MKKRIVSREEFLAHLRALIYNETDEPCTLETPFPIRDLTAGGQIVGTGTISYFPEWTPDWLLKEHPEMTRLRLITRNHSGAGLRASVRSPQFGFDGFADELAVIEEEEQIAASEGVTLQYTIGQKADPFGMGKRGDPPGVDF
jgi:hypothetical protein